MAHGSTDDTPADEQTTQSRSQSRLRRLRFAALGILTFSLVAVDPVLAQSTGSAFCDTDMAETIQNLFMLIQFGGPLIGGVIALGGTVAMPAVRRSDMKRELKEARNQAVIWGIIVAPLGTAIVQFLLNNVVVGGTSCGF